MQLAEQVPMIYALKAGKVGFSSCEISFDAWRARFGPPHGRVHIFSRGAPEARDLLGQVRFGLLRLPPGLRWPLLSDVAGGDTASTLKLRNPDDPDDVRTIASYAAAPTASIDQSCVHLHMDELAHMIHAREVWGAASTTVIPGGTAHVVTRGSGEDHYAAELWRLAQTEESPLVPFFAPYDARPGRDRQWRERQGATMALGALLHFAPETAEDALAGDETSIFLEAVTWDACLDAELPPLDARTAIVLAVDLGIRHDYSAIVAASRHPSRYGDPAIRAVKVFRPAEHGGTVSLDAVEEFIRTVCKTNNVVQLCYDPWQFEPIAQRLQSDGVTWVSAFGQGPDRAVADSAFATLCLQRRLAHNGDPQLREAVLNARAHFTGVDDRQVRMVKRSPEKHIDAAVAASMSVSRVLSLNL